MRTLRRAMAAAPPPPRRLRPGPALLQLLLLCSLALPGARAAAAPPDINPLGITFDYKLAWIDAETSTYGATLQAAPQSTFVGGTKWSLLMRFAPDARANVTALSPGWGLGAYDYASWLLLPGSAPFDPVRLTIRSSGNLALETDIAKHAVPTNFMIVPSARPSATSTGYALVSGRDYTLNDGVNLAELPKAAFGPWLTLTAAPSAATPASASPAPPQTSATAADKAAEESDSPMATVLPPVPFIKGDPNYDPGVNPIGTVLSAPLVGPYLVNILLGIGILAHIAGTLRRMHFRRQYQMSVRQGKASDVLA
ncbi:hypothetical protein IWQ56_000701 [Coemansia nantahalensis]|nr:hypothetical protein IWQ56_000701 [Coemansia nantahalensis]